MTDSNYREVQRTLRRMQPALRKELNKALRSDVARIVLVAKGNASWSKTIPGAISPTVTTTGAGIKINGTKSPIGPLYERGNRGGPWRHPLFGNTDHWYSQSPRPFVAPAIAENTTTIVSSMEQAVNLAAHEVGLK